MKKNTTFDSLFDSYEERFSIESADRKLAEQHPGEELPEWMFDMGTAADAARRALIAWVRCLESSNEEHMVLRRSLTHQRMLRRWPSMGIRADA